MIFLEEKDFTDFLTVLGWVVKRYYFLLYTYCLMNHHYHLLIETPEGNLSRGMRQLNGLYAQRFNQRDGGEGKHVRLAIHAHFHGQS